MEFTSHAVIMEFSEFHVVRSFALFGLFVSLFRYPNFPFPSITTFMDWGHFQKFLPFSFSTVSWNEEFSIPLEPNEELASASNWEVIEVVDSWLVEGNSSIMSSRLGYLALIS